MNLDSLILTHGTEDNKLLLLFEGVEAYFETTRKGLFDANMNYRIFNEFLKQFHLFLDDINVRGCDLVEEKIRKTMKGFLEFPIPETKSRTQSIHSIFLTSPQAIRVLPRENVGKIDDNTTR